MVRRRDVTRTLSLEQPQRMKRVYQLLEFGSEVGSLSFLKTIGSLAEAKFDSQRYSLKRGGFLHPHVTVRRAPFDEEYALLKIQWGWGTRGILEFANGSMFTLLGPTLRERRWAFTDQDGNEIVIFRLRPRAFAVSGECEISYELNDPDPLLLALIGWYFVIMTLQEQTAAVAAAAGAGSS